MVEEVAKEVAEEVVQVASLLPSRLSAYVSDSWEFCMTFHILEPKTATPVLIMRSEGSGQGSLRSLGKKIPKGASRGPTYLKLYTFAVSKILPYHKIYRNCNFGAMPVRYDGKNIEQSY